MSGQTTCQWRDKDEALHRWVAGSLPSEDTEALEDHLLTCAACQETVREALAIRASLATRHTRAVRRRVIAGGLGVALAASLTAIVVFSTDDDALDALGKLDAVPRFEVERVRRPATDSADALVDDAIAAYSSGSFGRAAELFGRAAALSPAPAVSFFHGASLLAAGQSAEAVSAFSVVLTSPPNVYQDEARIYLAKAFIRLGRADSALATLRRSAATNTVARALADSIARVVRP